MSKPRKRVIDYFPHMVNHKKTLHILESQWGNDGYAFWFKLLELLGKTEGHCCNCNKADEWYYLISYTKIPEGKALEILNRLAELEAINPALWKQKYIWSQNFVNGVADVYKKRLTDTPVQPVIRRRKPVSNETTDDRNPQSKVKESKVKESKEYAPGIRIPIEEYDDLCERFGKKKIDGIIERISDYQLSKGKKKYEDYPATIKNWMRKDAGVDSVKELEIPKIPKCPKCGKSWENEINNNKSHCMGCNTPVPKSRGP